MSTFNVGFFEKIMLFWDSANRLQILWDNLADSKSWFVQVSPKEGQSGPARRLVAGPLHFPPRLSGEETKVPKEVMLCVFGHTQYGTVSSPACTAVA